LSRNREWGGGATFVTGATCRITVGVLDVVREFCPLWLRKEHKQSRYAYETVTTILVSPRMAP
jgi:hypothetical protein